jgi:hypothetical protein
VTTLSDDPPTDDPPTDHGPSRIIVVESGGQRGVLEYIKGYGVASLRFEDATPGPERVYAVPLTDDGEFEVIE